MFNIHLVNQNVTIPAQEGVLLSQACADAGFPLDLVCGGQGKCGKCKVDIARMGKKESVLACIFKVDSDMEVWLKEEQLSRDGSILTEGKSTHERRLDPALTRTCYTRQQLTPDHCGAALSGVSLAVARRYSRLTAQNVGEITFTRYRDTVIAVDGGDQSRQCYGAAVDIGTTTVALSLYDLQTGVCMAQTGMLNPQTAAAADVMGRIGAAMAGESDRLRAQVTEAIRALLLRACAQAAIDETAVESLAVTGNTTMLYLLTGRNPASLSRAPFQADCLFDETVALCGRQAYLPPCMHAFVGADITCAVLDSGLCEKRGVALLCDVGTNGELALWKDGTLLVTSTAAGPAFEGAGISCGCGSVRGAVDRVIVRDGQLSVHTIGEERAVGVCGSGLIDGVAAALSLGAVDETGAMEGDSFELTEDVRLTPGDIRAVQLAKAAVAAGIDTLLDEAGVRAEDAADFLIAGGFGSCLNVENAAAIGLFPGALSLRARPIGNAALSGAARLLLNVNEREHAREIVRRSKHVNLGGNPAFNQHYMDRMMFPEE